MTTDNPAIEALALTVGIGTAIPEKPAIPDVIEALAQSVQSVGPRCVGFLATEQSRRYADHIRRVTAAESAVIEIVAEVDDLTACLTHATRLLDRLLSRVTDSSEVAVEITSGSVAMRVGLALAAVARDIRSFRLVGGQRSMGLVATGTEEFRRFEPAAFFAEHTLAIAKELIKRYRFNSARQLIQTAMRELSRSSRRRASRLERLAVAFQSWDLFRHAEALRAYEQVSREGELGEFAVSDDTLAKLHDLARDRKTLLGMADLVANSRRRVEEGRFDDAVGRLYRALELATQIGLSKVGLDAADLDTSRIRDKELRLQLERERRIGRKRTGASVRVGLLKGLRVLEDQGHPLGRLSRDRDLQRALEHRNQSILAHGLTPVDRAAAERLGGFIYEAAHKLGNDFGELVRALEFPWSHRR